MFPNLVISDFTSVIILFFVFFLISPLNAYPFILLLNYDSIKDISTGDVTIVSSFDILFLIIY